MIDSIQDIFFYNEIPYQSLSNKKHKQEIDLWIIKLAKMRLDTRLYEFKNVSFGIDRSRHGIHFPHSENIPATLAREIIKAYINRDNNLHE